MSGTVADDDARVVGVRLDGLLGAIVSPYQVARVVVRTVAGHAVPLISWGLPDLHADRLAGVDSHAHARL